MSPKFEIIWTRISQVIRLQKDINFSGKPLTIRFLDQHLFLYSDIPFKVLELIADELLLCVKPLMKNKKNVVIYFGKFSCATRPEYGTPSENRTH